MATIIQRGDQYAIPISILMGEDPVTPDMVDDVRVQINDLLKSYQEGTLLYNEDEQLWEFPLTEEFTRNMELSKKGSFPYQVGVKMGDNFLYSKVYSSAINESLITENWGE